MQMRLLARKQEDKRVEGINAHNEEMNYESEYAFQTLLYISRMASEGDFITPENMGMSSDQHG